jgi:hypothetical protein
MKMHAWIFASLFCMALVAASGAHAQAHPEHRTITEVLDFWVTDTERLVVPAADAMPESKYSFAPENGEFKGVRTFGEQVKHLAAANYQLGAMILGENPPSGTANETAPASIQTKAEILEYVKGSFALLHRAAAAIDERNLTDSLPVKGNRTRLWLLIDAVAHSSNHYGQMVEYLRLNGIVPPASR